MEYKAIAKFVAYSPYKLRPIVDVIRGKKVKDALSWLEIYKNKRTLPVHKVVSSAIANANNLSGKDLNLEISKVFIDNGPVRKYFKPGSRGRGQVLRRRFSHITVYVKEFSNKRSS